MTTAQERSEHMKRIHDQRMQQYLENILKVAEHIDTLKDRVLHHVAQQKRYGYSVEYFTGVQHALDTLEETLEVLEAEAEESYVIGLT